MNREHAEAVAQIEELMVGYFDAIKKLQPEEPLERLFREAAQLPLSEEALSHLISSLPNADRWGISLSTGVRTTWKLFPVEARISWLRSAYYGREIPF